MIYIRVDGRNNRFMLFSNIKKALPKESRTNINNDGLMIDGVLHWIRYEEAGTVKEYRYFNAESLLTKSEYSSEKIEILDVHNEIIEHYF